MDSGNNTNRWNLTAANTYTGTTTISSGALGISNANALGALGAGSGTSVAAGAALFIRASIPSIAAETLSIAGNGSAGGGGALRSVSGSSTWNGTIAANATTANVAIGSDTGVFTLSNTADITVTGNNTLQLTNQSVTSTGALVVNGNISGTAGVSKITSPLSFVTFGGDAKDYSGATTVTTGTFTLNTSILNTSTVTVAAPGILRGDGGVINPLATTTIAGRIAPGATTSPGIGTMTMGALSLANASTTDIDIDSLTLGTDVLMTGNLNIDAGAILALNDLGAGSITSGALLFLKYSGIWNGGLFTVNGQVITDNGTIFSVGGNSYQLDYNYSGPLGSGVALLATVPEPATMSLAGLAALMVGLRRRRVKSVG
jgi:autotransporter-associated beta strand protein